MPYSPQLITSICEAIDRKYANPAVRALRKFEKICGPGITPGPSSAAWIEEFTRIEDKKTAKLIAPTLNLPQRILNDAVDEARLRGVPFRAVNLKSRRFGISRWALLRGWYEIVMQRNFNAAIVANKKDVAADLLTQLEDNLLGKLPFPPPIKRRNRGQVTFAPPLSSGYRIASAKDDEPLRGNTTGYRFVHCTETAFWEDAERKMVAINQAVPSEAGTVLMHETTANGQSGFLYELFWDAIDGKSSYRPFFFPWFSDPDFDYCLVLNAVQEQEIAETLDEEEKWLLTECACNFGQLAWRRQHIADNFWGDLEWFRQEFPATPDEAFRAPGRRVFSPKVIADLRGECFVAPHTGELRPNGKSVEFVQEPRGRLQLWRMPDPSMSYVVGADAAEGVEEDYSVAWVLDAHTGAQIARWRCNRTSPGEFGRALCLLGEFFNTAYVLPERKNPGPAVIEAMLAEGYYMIGRMPAFATSNANVSERLGWDTNVKSKSLMYDWCRTRWQHRLAEVVCEDTLLEAAALFVEVTENGEKVKCPKGRHDDDIDAYCVALMAQRYAAESELFEEPEEKRTPTYSERHWQVIREQEQAAERQRRGVEVLIETGETMVELEEEYDDD